MAAPEWRPELSTRANIIIIDDAGDELIFYRHSDGYPDGTLPSLTSFVEMVAHGLIRDNVGQAAGWLILLGASEYGLRIDEGGIVRPSAGAGMEWKVGAYEPTSGLHGDIEFLYIVDLAKPAARHCKVDRSDGEITISRPFYSGSFNPERSDERHVGLSNFERNGRQ